MCNACGFQCCAYDGFSGCGCDGCDEPECWSDASLEEMFGDKDDADSLFDDGEMDQVQGRSCRTIRSDQKISSAHSAAVAGMIMAKAPIASIAKRQFPAIRSTATRSPKDRHDVAGTMHPCCAGASDNIGTPR